LIEVGVFGLEDDLTFNAQLLLALHKFKKDFYFFPITWSESGQISNAKVLRQGTRITIMCLKYLFGKEITSAKSRNNYDFVIINEE
jgi:hypothetical protein